MGDALILTMDGSTSVCSAALLSTTDDGQILSDQVLARKAETNGRGQAKILLRQVDEMMREMGAEPPDLERIVVGVGPGTFTGVRIAVATARGLSLALEVPVFGVSTLSALAAWALDAASPAEVCEYSSVVAMVDARRRQIFYAEYELATSETPEGVRWTRAHPIGVCDRERFSEVFGERSGSSIAVGEGENMVGGLPHGMRYISCDVRAEYLVIGQQRLTEQPEAEAGRPGEDGPSRQTNTGAPETVKPIYVRAPDADSHITKMRDPWADAGAGR